MRTKRLTARGVKTAKVGKHDDGGGLRLVVRANGSRAWVFRYQREGHRREMGLGPLEDLSLAEARDAAREARQKLRAGFDPIEDRRADKANTKAVAPTFAECCSQYIDAQAAGWRNPKHRDQWATTLSTYAYPFIGTRPVDRVEMPDVLEILKPLWTTRPETASRLRGRIERVLDWARVKGHRSGENPARWRGHLQALLPPRSKVRAVRHHAAMPWQDVPAFMARLREVSGVAARALELVILTAARSGEVRFATWEELDLPAKVWTVPAERMKAHREHRVPLSPAAVTLLEGLPWRAETGLVFPSPVTDKALSDAALGKVLKDLSEPVTAHGFRSSFRDWTAEATLHPREVAEQALAHTLPSAVEAAYRRGDLFMKRTKLMGAWAKFCLSPPAKRGAVVPFQAKAARQGDGQ